MLTVLDEPLQRPIASGGAVGCMHGLLVVGEPRVGRRSADRLERLLETEAAKGLGVETDIFVRTDAEWRAIIAANPFPAEAERDPGHLVLMCLKTSPAAEQAYIVYPDGIGTSRLTLALIERKLGTRGTGRNWNTVLRLAEVLFGP